MSRVRPEREMSIDDLAGRLIDAIESGAVVFLFMLVVLTGLVKAFLEHFTGMETAWVGELMSALLLWLVMVGSAAGAGRLRHLRVRGLEWLLPERQVTVVRRLVFFIAALTSLVLVWYSLQAVLLEREFTRIAFGRIPLWTVQVIVPVGFAIMGVRFLAWALVPPAVTACGQDEEWSG